MEQTIIKNKTPKLLKTEAERKQLRYSYFLNELAEQTKAEFINGEIVVQSPARKKHIDANTSLTIMLKLHVEKYKLGWLASEKALVKMKKSDNDFEPDVCYFSTKKTKNFNKNTWQFPPPDLAIEILSDSSIPRDRKTKFNDYANHGVEEYWIIDSDDFEIEQYYLEKTGKYILAKKYYHSETIKSIVIKKLEIPVDAIFFYEDLNNYLYHKHNKKIKEKDEKIKEKDEKIKEKDEEIKEKNEEIKEKNEEIKEKNKLIKQQATIIKQLSEK